MKKKTLIWILVIFIAVIIIASIIYYYFFVQKSLQLRSPNGKEVLTANKTYQITWRASKIGKVGIMLIKEGEVDTKSSEWIARNVSASDGKYDWNVFVWQEPRQDYKISIFEYPWQEGGMIDYSDETFTILGPQFASCDSLSVEKEWPFLPSDYTNLRMAFITKQTYKGNLGGLVGADEKCQTEAVNKGLEGTWKALLGDDETLATDRLNLDGIFVNALSAGTIPENKTCHQLWGNNFADFFKKLSDTVIINQQKFDSEFLNSDLPYIWLGRINKDSRRDCVLVFASLAPSDPSKFYSFTTTCQNWTAENDIIPGYTVASGKTQNYPKCYNSLGQNINAVSLSGLATGITGPVESKYFSPDLGRTCNSMMKLICVKQ